jgi:curved DNA-binding protein
MVEFKDYYKSLGVNRKTEEAGIKEAFKKLAKKYHPDASEGSEEKFKEINEAYEVLRDKKKRIKYDYLYDQRLSQDNYNTKSQAYKQRKMYSDYKSYSEYKESEKQEQPKADPNAQAKQSAATNKPNESGTGFSDFFEMLFGKYKEQAGLNVPPKEPKQGEDYEMDIELNLEDAYHGSVRKIEISTANKTTRRLEVTIPAGVREGNKIKIANEGKPGINSGPSGDLYLKVKIKKHPVFWLEGDDVHSDIELETYEAVLGADKKVMTLDSPVELVIPARTQNGKTLRLRGRGFKNPKDGTVGDHYIHAKIKIPVEPSEEEIALYKQLEKLAESKKVK